MAPDDPHYSYNMVSNEDKELLLRNGYKPGELSPEDEKELIRDLRDQLDNDDDSDRYSDDIPGDEKDSTQ